MLGKGKGRKEEKLQEGRVNGIYPQTGTAAGLQCSKFLQEFKIWPYCPLIYKVSASSMLMPLNETLEFILHRCQRLHSHNECSDPQFHASPKIIHTPSVAQTKMRKGEESTSAGTWTERKQRIANHSCKHKKNTTKKYTEKLKPKHCK